MTDCYGLRDIVCGCFFSSRRRHTRCALVTGVQTGALPISWLLTVDQAERFAKASSEAGAELVPCDNLIDAIWQDQPPRPAAPVVTHPTQLAGRSRSEERRVGKECVGTCRSRG